jgi:hypothetical protein
VHLAFEFAWAVLPVLLGALAGWHIRRRFCTHATPPNRGAVAPNGAGE